MKGSLQSGSAVGWPLALAVSVACAPHSSGQPGAPSARDGPIISRQAIEQSGARDGWEALRRGVTHLSFQQPREGSPVRVTRRGVSSFFIDPQVLLVVDGTHIQDLSFLETLPAANIEYIQILSASVGVLKYGSKGGNGVIVVKTGVPPPRHHPDRAP